MLRSHLATLAGWALSITGPLAADAGQSAPKLTATEVPHFHLRARVTSIAGAPPASERFRFGLGLPGTETQVAGGGWSDWIGYGDAQAERTLKGYPAIYMHSYPVVVKLSTAPVKDPTHVEAELKLDETGEVVPLRGDLFGPTLGILVWRDAEHHPHAATMAEYNRRYWKELEKPLRPSERPRKFPLVDRLINGDDDRTAWREGMSALGGAGMTALMVPPSRPLREVLHGAGVEKSAWAVYNPPGYTFDYDPKVTPEAIREWAEKEAKPYRAAGFGSDEVAMFAMSDEPGWYYPRALHDLEASPAGMARFRDYLQGQGLTPAQLGSTEWSGVRPTGRSEAGDLPSRRRFYWTCRFLSWDSARHFATCTRALETAFRPGLPVTTNWNFFSGRFWVPGAVANNADKTSPDAAMGGHDWSEFGRLRGGTMLWTEDWFGDGQAYQWSLYASRLRCAAAKSGVSFGGYVVPRAAGDREDGLLQKILCLFGSGGKAAEYFVFGPEYNFPGNCYSERPGLLPKLAEAHRMIGSAERLLWPGKRPTSRVAILMPRSAEVWDERGEPRGHGISDATNTNLNGSTVDYMAEVADLYLALQHANIPVDFVDEDDLTPAGLKPYRALYVTEPDLPEEGQGAIAGWLRTGGVVALSPGAATSDRYDDPSSALSKAGGPAESRKRELLPSMASLRESGRGKGVAGELVAYGPRAPLTAEGSEVVGSFSDGTAAVTRRRVGKGSLVRYGWFPGLSYARSASGTRDRLPSGFSEDARKWALLPLRFAGTGLAPVIVDRPLVETPILESSSGAAVTLLNWTGERIPRLQVSLAQLPRAPRKIASVKRGALTWSHSKDGITVQLPLDGADILMVDW